MGLDLTEANDVFEKNSSLDLNPDLDLFPPSLIIFSLAKQKLGFSSERMKEKRFEGLRV